MAEGKLKPRHKARKKKKEKKIGKKTPKTPKTTVQKGSDWGNNTKEEGKQPY